MKKALIIFVLFCFSMALYAQNVTVTDDQDYTADTSAMLDVKSTTKGMLVPRVTTTQRNSIFQPATGLLVFDIDISSFFFYNGSGWTNLSHSNASDSWKRDGNNIYLTDDFKVGINKTNPLSALEVKANSTAADGDPLFQVINKTGDTVFAVFPHGVQINFDETAKGNIGGFAVSGRNATKGTREYFRITSDSTRIYLNENLKGNIGGFAVSGRSASKGAYDEFFRVTPDSTRVYVNKSTKGNIGGFAVSGRSAYKGTEEKTFITTPDSTRVYISENLKGNIGGFAVSGRNATKEGETDYMKVNSDSTTIYTTLTAVGNMNVNGNIYTGGTVSTPPISDIDGNVYQTIKIGTQTWMTENLKTGTYNTGLPISLADVTYYDDDISNVDSMGLLYSYYAAVENPEGICPDGWHVPDEYDWEDLFTFLGGIDYSNNLTSVGEKMIEPSSSWLNLMINVTNQSGFSGRPGGYAFDDGGTWLYLDKGSSGRWWGWGVGSNVAASYHLNGEEGLGYPTTYTTAPAEAFSVRCIKDNW